MRVLVRRGGLFLPTISIVHIWAMAAPAAIFLTSAQTPIQISDFWWHLKVGEDIVTGRHIPTADAYSFVTAGQPYAFHEWLAEVYLYLLYSAGGLELPVLANTLALTAVTALTLATALEVSHSPRIAAACTLAGMAVAMSSRDVRPQVLGFVLFALLYLLLTRYRHGRPAPLWLLPILAALWANLHGSAILGLGLCVLVLAGEALKAWLGLWPDSALSGRKLARLGLATASIPIAMLLNPWGPGIFGYALAIQRHPVIQSVVTEWFAPTLRKPEDLPFFVVLLALVALLALAPRSLELTDTILLVVFCAMALQAVRNSVWFGIVAAPLAARQAASIYREWSQPLNARLRDRCGATLLRSDDASPSAHRQRAIANYAFASLIVGVTLLFTPWAKQGLSLPPERKALIDPATPVAAVEYLSEHYPGERFFHPMTYGSYMVWGASGHPQVFVDGRIELYPLSVWEDYTRISVADDWERRLAKYGIRHVLLSRSQSAENFQRPLLLALQESPDWEAVYEDDNSVVYVRRT